MASSLNLVNLDHDSLKESLKSYLRSQDKFRDYDFDGSNMSVLLDILAYNTSMNAFYLNMVGSEMFLDTAQLKDSVTSHAKDLNYVPRSFTSSVATIELTVNTGNTAVTSVTVPKGTTFTSRVGSNTYTFSTDRNIVMTGESGIFTKEIDIYEGKYFTDTYVYNSANSNQRFIISNPTVDIDSLSVTTVEDSGSVVYSYLRYDTLFGIDSDTKAFFVQMTHNDRYEVVFGDGVIGRQPIDHAAVVLESRICNGELPNGAFKFSEDGPVAGYSNVTIVTVTAATNGSVGEDIDSIRFNAPRAFTTQERAVTTEDYENLLKARFPEINVVSAYGGEEADPPQHGKVFISVDIQNLDGLPKSKEIVYKRYIKERSPMSIDPIFVEPEHLYIYVEGLVRYNLNTTTLSDEDIRVFALSKILEYNSVFLDDFKATLRYSQLIRYIDDSHSSIVSNETTIRVLKRVTPTIGRQANYTVAFGLELASDAPVSGSKSTSVLYSNPFVSDNRVCYLQANANGVLYLMTDEGASTVKSVGSVSLDTGLVRIQGLKIDRIVGGGSYLKLYIRTDGKDITSTRNSILSIVREDVNLEIEAVRQ